MSEIEAHNAAFNVWAARVFWGYLLTAFLLMPYTAVCAFRSAKAEAHAKGRCRHGETK